MLLKKKKEKEKEKIRKEKRNKQISKGIVGGGGGEAVIENTQIISIQQCFREFLGVAKTITGSLLFCSVGIVVFSNVCYTSTADCICP